MMKCVSLAVLLALLPPETNAQQPPVPILKKSRPDSGYGAVTAAPGRNYGPVRGQGWRVFQGATRCEQTGGMLSCDNGYSARVR